MSHKCTGPSCYKKTGRRPDCPRCKLYNAKKREKRLFASARKRKDYYEGVFAALDFTDHAKLRLFERQEVTPFQLGYIVDRPIEQHRWLRWINGELRTHVVGRAPDNESWIVMVFSGDYREKDIKDMPLITVFQNDSFSGDFGGKPWLTI